MFLFFLLAIILQGFLVKSIVINDIDSFAINKTKNPIPWVPAADNYHIWDDRLYFTIGDIVYQYDISDKSNITYLNAVNISDCFLNKIFLWDFFYSQIIFHEDVLFVCTQNISTDEKIDLKLIICDLTANGIVKNRTIEYVRDDIARILCCYQQKIIIGDISFKSLYIIDFGQQNPNEESIAINNETFEHLPYAILNENTLYLWDRNYFNYEFIFGSLLIYNIENLNNPLFVDSWISTEPNSEFFYPNKVGNILYLESENNTAVALNITDITNITEIGTFLISSEVRHDIKIFDHYAIAINPLNITIYDISEIENSVMLGNYTTSFEVHSGGGFLEVFDGLIFASNVYIYGMMILDWLNPEELFELDITLPDLTKPLYCPPTNIIGFECFWIILTIILPTFTFVLKLIRKGEKCC